MLDPGDASAADIDTAMREGWGLPRRPLEVPGDLGGAGPSEI